MPRRLVGAGLSAAIAAVLPIHSVWAAPSASARPDQLLPAPFRAEYRVDADLDGDGDLDAAVVGVDGVVPTPEENDFDAGEGRRVLLFARKDRDGYRRVGLGLNAVMCRTCGGAFWGVIPAPIELSVTKPSGGRKGPSSVVVEQMSGARETQEWTHRYRFEQGKVRLIGRDFTSVDRGSGASWTQSVNELTGTTIVTIEGDADTALKAGTTKRAPKFVTVESVRLD